MRRILIPVVLSCLISVPALATQPASYVAVKLGLYSPQANDMEDFSNGVNGELAVGHYFNPNIAGEFGVGYFRTDADFSGSDPILGSFSESDEITVYPVTVSVKAIAPIPGGELYVGAGLGAYIAKVESDLFISAFGQESQSASDTVFGGQIMGGGNIDVAPNIYLGAEIKYLWAKPSFSATFFGIPVTLDAKMDGLVATANLGFRF